MWANKPDSRINVRLFSGVDRQAVELAGEVTQIGRFWAGLGGLFSRPPRPPNFRALKDVRRSASGPWNAPREPWNCLERTPGIARWNGMPAQPGEL